MLNGMCGGIQEELDRLTVNHKGATDLQRPVATQAFFKASKCFSA
jgi:hypothetical protein